MKVIVGGVELEEARKALTKYIDACPCFTTEERHHLLEHLLVITMTVFEAAGVEVRS